MLFICLHVCLYGPFPQRPEEGMGTGVGATIWVLGIKSGYSGGTASALS